MELNTPTPSFDAVMGTAEIEEETTGEDTMTGNIGTDTAGVLALLADTSRAGNRGGYGGFGGEGGGYNMLGPGNSVLAANAHADGTATKTAIDCHADSASAALDRVSAQNIEGRFNDAITSLRDGQFQSELRGGDRARDTDRTLQDMRLEQCKCCEEAKLLAQQIGCETQKLIIEKTASTDALILAVEGRANVDKLAEARNEIAYLRNNHHHRAA